MTRRHDPEICAAVGHRYWTFLVLWCPHLQAWTVHRSSYVETGMEGDPLDYVSDEVQLGPFDGPAELAAVLEAWTSKPDPPWSQPSPRLPG